MQERVYRVKLSDILVETTFYEEVFCLSQAQSGSVMAQLRSIHQHATYEIFLVLTGSLTVTDVEGSRVYSRCAVLIPPGYDHYTTSQVKEGCCFYFAIVPEEKAAGSRYEQLHRQLSRGVTVLPLEGSGAFYAARFIETGGLNGERVAPLLQLLLLELFEKLAPAAQKEAEGEKRSKYIHIIEHAIVRNISWDGQEKLTLQSLAKELCLCPRQVTRVIRKEYGCTLSELVNRRRLTAACMLLKHTDLSIGKIAESVGYAYENYFFSLFKKTYGISPMQYRNAEK